MKENQLVEIGYCSKPHGIKGEFTFVIYDEFVEDLENGSYIQVKGKNSRSSLHNKIEQYEIEKINYGHKVMVKLKEVEDRNTVEDMIPFTVLLDRELIDELHEGKMLIEDYIGMDVVAVGTNKNLGKVSDLYETAAQIILVIGKGQDSFEIPLVENFVKEVDLENKKITIVVPEFVG
jgi:16S rRNA processing protein RimM